MVKLIKRMTGHLNNILKVPQRLSFENLYNSVPYDKNLYNRIRNFSYLLLETPYGHLDDNDTIDNNEFKTIDAFIEELCYKSEFSYSFDKLDCVTFVETVLALANIDPLNKDIDNLAQFENNLRNIRYFCGQDNYIHRNHIFSLDWCPNNSNIIDDITLKLSKELNLISLMAKSNINKINFFKKSKIEKHYNLPNYDKYIEQLKKLVHKSAIQKVTVPYIPIDIAIDKINEFVKILPDVVIMLMVRPSWNLIKLIGTELNISHLGFVINNGKKLMFVHATSIGQKQVVALPLLDYLKRFQSSSTVQGINFHKII